MSVDIMICVASCPILLNIFDILIPFQQSDISSTFNRLSTFPQISQKTDNITIIVAAYLWLSHHGPVIPIRGCQARPGHSPCFPNR